MKNKKKNKKSARIRERKSLRVRNHGDTVIIKSRISLSACFSGVMMMAICIAGAIALKGAWDNPVFLAVVAMISFVVLYSFVNIIFGKIVLNSHDLTMTVCNPIKKVYKFADINYIDKKTSKSKDGVITHRVIVYIGEGRKSVELVTLSSRQADDIVSLLRGMLDNGAMIYPEGDEEPFDFSEDEKKPLFPFFIKKKKEEKEKDTEKPKRKMSFLKAEKAPADEWEAIQRDKADKR